MALRLMRRTDVPETARVYRYSPVHALLFFAVPIGIAARMVIVRWPGPRASFWFAGAILLVIWLLRRFVLARFLESNWLVRQADDGLFIQFRSYLNYHMSEEDATVVFVPYSDIGSARLVRERTETKEPDGKTYFHRLRLVELELAADPAQLASALADECGRPAAMEKHWYVTSSTLYRHYPVRMQTPPFLRVEWQVVPGIAAFLKALPAYLLIAPPIAVTEDFADLQYLSREQQEQRLRQLEDRGNTMAAVYMARRLYGYDLTEATKFVKGLHGTE